MILNKFTPFFKPSQGSLSPALTIDFALFRQELARFVTPLTAHDTSKLTENQEDTGRCTTQSSGKGVND